jgi:hypothetical protein
MDRLNRILGVDFVNNWLLTGSMTDNLNPWAQRDLSTYDTPEKRAEIVADEYQYTRTTRGTMMVILHDNYTLAFIELAAEQAEFDMAVRIQKRIRGVLARDRFWSPYTEVGRARINKMCSEL